MINQRNHQYLYPWMYELQTLLSLTMNEARLRTTRVHFIPR
jgi:hypothetical protein